MLSPKRTLWIATFALGVAGMFAAAYPFIASLRPNAKAEDAAWSRGDLSDLAPGEIRELGSVWVYRRTVLDFESYEALRSHYEYSAEDALRSSNPEYFVFLPFAPRRGCGVKFVKPSSRPADGLRDDHDLIAPYPHFIEPCEGRVFDTAGRVLKMAGYPPEEDLRVPVVVWKSSSIFQVKGT